MAGEWPRRQMTLRHDGSHRIIGNSRIYIYLSFSLYIYIYIYMYIYILYIYTCTYITMSRRWIPMKRRNFLLNWWPTATGPAFWTLRGPITGRDAIAPVVGKARQESGESHRRSQDELSTPEIPRCALPRDSRYLLSEKDRTGS
jgi:hypothetical protein